MEVKKLIGLMEIKEMQAAAYFDYYLDKIPIEVVQNMLDGYCERMAESFVKNHYAEFEDEETLVSIRRYISSFGSDKEHSGKRFYEALYKKLKEFGSYVMEKE